MPQYKVQLKQGSRTIVEYIECSSVASALSFFESVTTMKVTEILKIEYQAPENTIIPNDDFQYRKIYKAFIKDTTTNQSRQVIFHNIKLTVNENELANYIMAYLEIEGLKADSVYCSLFKM